MKAFDVCYELSALSTEGEPEVDCRRVIAPSADRAAEMVAKELNTRVNCRKFWVHSILELPSDDEQTVPKATAPLETAVM